MNNAPTGQNFRPRRNNNYKKNNGGGHRQDFRRGSNNNNHSFNTGQGGGPRHPELDIVIDARAAKRASMMRDKYQSMARDAQSGGDRVHAEYCSQHAEHYNRVLNAYNESRPQHLRENIENNDEAQNGELGAEASAPQAAPAAQPNTIADDETGYQAASSN